MAKDKLKRWAENKTFPHVFEPNLMPIIRENTTFMKGQWREEFYNNDNPLVVELGCGKGEYAVGQAQRNLDKNYLGIDVKGHRFHKGAKDSLEMGLTNVAFLRARIEFIDAFFDDNELDEIWLTFSDPMPNDHDGNRRITSGFYMKRYERMLKSEGLVHIKHDNPALYERALREIPLMGAEIIFHDDKVQNVDGEQLRYINEATRHKILDLIGDLMISGKFINAHFVCYKSGHALNYQILKFFVSL
jgi:tRNA (guanine-N7-)-methyltransferase